MKITNINARMDTSGKHNDRNFDIEKAAHIDPLKTPDNEYYTYNGERIMSFRELELEFYGNHFETAIEAANKKHEHSRHKDRMKTIEQYYKSKRTMPEDKILQIGDINEHATKEELWECALEYKDRFNDIFGDHCIILDMALHMDEATPHVHVRRVWIAEDKHGREVVSQTKALEQLGILRPNLSKEEGRYNNAKMTFTQTDIELFKTICYEHGLDVDMERPTERQVHLDSKKYKTQQKAKELDRVESSVNALANFIKENPYLVNMYEDQLKEAEEKSLSKRNEILVQIMVDAYESLHGQIEIADKYRVLKEYVEEKGLMDDYDEWRDDKHPELTNMNINHEID